MYNTVEVTFKLETAVSGVSLSAIGQVYFRSAQMSEVLDDTPCFARVPTNGFNSAKLASETRSSFPKFRANRAQVLDSQFTLARWSLRVADHHRVTGHVSSRQGEPATVA